MGRDENERFKGSIKSWVPSQIMGCDGLCKQVGWAGERGQGGILQLVQLANITSGVGG